ncbi:reverse transcriptase [Tanacetum coccineum]
MAPNTPSITNDAGGSSGAPVFDENVRKAIHDVVDARFTRMQESIEALTRLMAERGLMDRPTKRNASNGQQSPYTRLAKLEFSKFLGDDVKGLVFRCEQFFILDQVIQAEKLHLISIHLYDKALLWHTQFLKSQGGFVTWEDYKQAILARFGTVNDDPINEISKDHAISLFIGGLLVEIAMAVRMFKPRKLADAYSLTNLQEATINAVKKKGRMLYNGSISGNARYTPGHNCSGQMYALEVLAGTKCEEECLGEEDLEELGEVPQISLNAMHGIPTYRTIRIKGVVGKHAIHILVDCGSTHNFVDIVVAKKLGCKIKSTCPLPITVGDGYNIATNSECKQFHWQLQGVDFWSDVMLLPLVGCEMGKNMVLEGTPKSNMEWMTNKKQAKILKKTNHPEYSSMQLCVFSEHEISLMRFEGIPTEVKPELSSQPVNVRPYRHPPTQKDAREGMVQELLDTGVIRPSNSPFASPIVMVKKKDNTWRMRVDYRLLNKQTIKDKFSTPVIEELIDELHGSQVFTKLDLSKSLEEHVVHLRNVLEVMKTHQLYAKLSKCVFGTKQVEYLGHVISVDGVSTDPTKIKAIEAWPVLNNLKQLRGFLDLTGYYRRFIKSYASISRPLTLLLKKNSFQWNKESQVAFESLKKAMISAQVLALPDIDKEFTMETDASGIRIGAVLIQGGHPIAYLNTWEGINELKAKFDNSRKKALPLSPNGNKCHLGGGGPAQQSGHFYPLVLYCSSGWHKIPCQPLSYIGYSCPLHTTDGQTEVVNRGLECYLRCMCGETPKDWGKWLSLAEWWYNTNYHSVLKTTPYEVLYGQTPPIHIPYVSGESRVDTVDRTLTAREEVIKALTFHLKRSQERMKTQADKHRSEREFAVGDWVYLKLQPHRQVSMRMGKFKKKLSTNLVANPYVFHVSQLKRCKGQNLQVGIWPQCDNSGLIQAQPVAILERKLGKVGNAAGVFVLMQWANSGPEDATC